jgi:hypothetical protein
VTDSLGNLLTGLAGVLGSAAFLIALLLFMGLDSAGFERRLAAVAVVRPATASALTIWAAGTRRYLAVSSLFGLIVAVIDGAVLAALGVPLPILWALLAFITNYIPNIAVAAPECWRVLVAGPPADHSSHHATSTVPRRSRPEHRSRPARRVARGRRSWLPAIRAPATWRWRYRRGTPADRRRTGPRPA